MRSLELVTAWPVDHVAAAVVVPGRDTATIGDPTRRFRVASLSKPMAAWAVLVAVEEGIVELDAPPAHVAVQEGCTLRHLLAGVLDPARINQVNAAWTT